ncbi:MAG: glycosyltransferase family 4 protein [Acidobacteriota bacterium]
MRILLVANTLPPTDLSGAGEQVMQLAVGLRAAGHEVEVLGRGAPHGARGPKVLFPLTIVPATWRALRRFRPDVVQVNESDAGLAALLVALLRAPARLRGRRPRLVALLQVSYVEELRAVRPLRHAGRVLGRPGRVERRFRWLKAPVQIVLGVLTARLADRVLAPSRRTAGELARDYGVRGEIAVLPNVTGGLPPKTDDPSAPSDDARAEPPGYLLYVGRLRIRKGVEVLLEALAQRTAAGAAPARLLIVGSGEHRDALERRADALALGDQVRFLGRRGAGQIRRLLRGARCLVVPSTYEGMPLVILEAMDEGTPVVASAVSGIPEVVIDGETGWLVPPEDPPALAASLDHVLADPDEAARRGETGRVRRASCYTPAIAADRWQRALDDAEVGA